MAACRGVHAGKIKAPTTMSCACLLIAVSKTVGAHMHNNRLSCWYYAYGFPRRGGAHVMEPEPLW